MTTADNLKGKQQQRATRDSRRSIDRQGLQRASTGFLLSIVLSFSPSLFNHYSPLSSPLLTTHPLPHFPLQELMVDTPRPS